MLVIVALEDGPHRFGTVRRRVEGISQKMLTKTLRKLEQDGLVTRTAYNEMPLRVEYSLTTLGRDLLPLIRAIKEWAEIHMAHVLAHREHPEAS